MRTKGYSLMELLVVISVLVIVMIGGTTIFLSNLRSGGMNEVQLKTSKSARSLMDTIESRLRYSKVVDIDSLQRDRCLLAGTDGVSGSKILFENAEGRQEEIGFFDGSITSSSAELNVSVKLNSDNVTVEKFVVEWFCGPGINDKIKLDLSLKGVGVDQKFNATEGITREMILLNSGTK